MDPRLRAYLLPKCVNPVESENYCVESVQSEMRVHGCVSGASFKGKTYAVNA